MSSPLPWHTATNNTLTSDRFHCRYQHPWGVNHGVISDEELFKQLRDWTLAQVCLEPSSAVSPCGGNHTLPPFDSHNDSKSTEHSRAVWHAIPQQLIILHHDDAVPAAE